MKRIIREPMRELPVRGEYDLCVVGGSCTGLFAAIRAARLGLSVVLVERMGCLGGVATLSLVNIWHSDKDELFEKTIFSGLTTEIMQRLQKRNAVEKVERNIHAAWRFNSCELQIELDEMASENGVDVWLHTGFAAPLVEDGQLTAIAVENKSGRSAIRAQFFIDASGDGDLCERLGLSTYRAEHRQPSTTCALFSGWKNLEGVDWRALIRDHGPEFGLPDGFSWGGFVPYSDLFMLAGTRVYQDCSTAEGFSRAEVEGRRQVRAIHDLLRKYAPGLPITLQSLPGRIGIRETQHVQCLHRLTGEEVLMGRSFPDAIANGSYRVDVHHDDKPGITFRYLDGREEYCRPGYPTAVSRWRPKTEKSPTFYQIPYRSLVPRGSFANVLAAGRFIDADEEAHAAIRVMVNMNQTGEAAGVAAYLALKANVSAGAVDTKKLQELLVEGGSLIHP